MMQLFRHLSPIWSKYQPCSHLVFQIFGSEERRIFHSIELIVNKSDKRVEVVVVRLFQNVNEMVFQNGFAAQIINWFIFN